MPRSKAHQPAPKKRGKKAPAKAPATVRRPKKSKPSEASPAAVRRWPIRVAWRVSSHPRFGRLFMAGSLAALLLTTLYWTVLSARLQETNSDQFSDAYLFENWPVFHGAVFPGAHTFILKWPLFLLMRLYGYQTFVFLAATVLMVLATVGTLVYVMYKIERRPVVFGALCLLLASCLLLVPAQPYAGAPLPVNFAMTTTRNLEYAVFVWSLYKSVAVTSIRQRMYWVAAGLLALVIASDKLFAVLLLGSGLMVLIVSVGLLRRRFDFPLAARLVLLAGIATGVGSLLLLAISRGGLTHIVNEATASPYPAIHGARQLALGGIYGFLGLLTVLGANPVHANLLARALPHDLLHSLLRPEIVAYACNFAVLVAGWFAAFRVLLRRAADPASRLTVALVGSTLAAAGVFVLTDHYYPVDARYVAIELFMVFIALATYLSGRQVRARYAVAVAVVAAVILPLGMVQSWNEYAAGRSVTALDRHIFSTVGEVLGHSHIRKLVGNYWKIMPVKAQDKEQVSLLPTDNCVQPHDVLASSAVSRLPATTPTAVLVNRDSPNVETFDGCSLAKLATLYGVPTQRVVLHRYPTAPYTASQFLLVYQHGTSPLKQPQPADAQPPPPAPQTVEALSQQAECTGTSLNVVAHEDDDLLFMNPDILHDIKAGRCERTVYLTAGDAGVEASYWHGREAGAQAAYAEMIGLPNSWHEERELLDGTFVTVASLDKAPSISLVFVRLPDGNLDGAGFDSTRRESLHLLTSGILASIHTVDDNTPLTEQQLVDMLHTLIETDAPDTIRSQGSNNLSDGDHSDHHAAGRLTRLAAEHDPSAPLPKIYLGYPDKLEPTNLSDDDIAAKQDAFLTYAKFDGAVCQTLFDCQESYTYGHYLTRQYPITEEGATSLPVAPVQTAPESEP